MGGCLALGKDILLSVFNRGVFDCVYEKKKPGAKELDPGVGGGVCVEFYYTSLDLCDLSSHTP
jgi:hypothetical protein